MAKASLRTGGATAAAVKTETVRKTDEVESTGIEVESTTTIAGGDGFDESLGINEGEGAATPPNETRALVPHESAGQVPATTGGYANPENGLEGEWAAEDLKFPSIKIVQGSGPMSERFPVGCLIYGEEELIPAAKNPANPEVSLRFVPLKLKKAYRENLSQDQYAAGQMPQIVQTVAEVEALGGTTQWIGREKPSWQPCATALVLLEAPKDCQHPGFAVEAGGKFYAPAVWYLTGAGFNNAAKPIFNNSLTVLLEPEFEADGKTQKRNHRGLLIRKPYMPKRFWTLRIIRKKVGDFNIFVPEVRLTPQDTGPELREYIASILGNGAAEVAPED